MPKLIPDSLTTNIDTTWGPGDPPQPVGGTQHIWALGDDDNVWHKYWDGHRWSAWENLGHP